MHTECRIDIDAPPESVWRALTEVELIKQWTPELISDEPEDDGPPRVGLVSKLQIKEGSRSVPYKMEITAFDRLEYLETVEISKDRNFDDLRFPVQYVIRPNLDYRGYAGEVSSGVVKKGDVDFSQI